MSLISRLPEFLQEIKEYKSLTNAEDIELALFKTKIGTALSPTAAGVLDNAFILTCDEDKLGYFENLYNSYVWESVDLETRRKWCLYAAALRNTPMTEAMLRGSWANYYGIHSLILRVWVGYDTYTIGIQGHAGFKDEVMIVNWINNWLRKKIPANMLLLYQIIRTHSDLEAYTHEYLQSYTHRQIEYMTELPQGG